MNCSEAQIVKLIHDAELAHELASGALEESQDLPVNLRQCLGGLLSANQTLISSIRLLTNFPEADVQEVEDISSKFATRLLHKWKEKGVHTSHEDLTRFVRDLVELGRDGKTFSLVEFKELARLSSIVDEHSGVGWLTYILRQEKAIATVKTTGGKRRYELGPNLTE